MNQSSTSGVTGFLHSRLARRLAYVVICFSLLITVLTTAIQLLADYQREIALIQESFRQLRTVHLPALQRNVWVGDDEQIQLQLNGLLHLQDITYLVIVVDGKTAWQAGNTDITRVLEKSIGLSYDYVGQRVEIGTLVVRASLEEVYARLWDQLLVVLIANGAKTFIVAGFMLVVFQHMVGRHLVRISEYVSGEDIRSGENRLSLDRPKLPSAHPAAAEDELENVVSAINERQVIVAQSLRALDARDEKLRSAFANVSVGLVMIDQRGSIQGFNNEAEKIFGYTFDEVKDRNVAMLMPSPYREEHDGYISRYRETGTRKIIGQNRDVKGVRKNGEVFHLRLGVGEVKGSGNWSFIGSIHDLTVEKELERQLIQSQKMDALGQLTGGISHDFNNILGIIIANAEMLQDELQDNAAAQRQTATLLRSAERGAALTHRLLAFSRQQPLHPTAVNISALLPSVTELLRRSIGKGIDLELEGHEADCFSSIDAAQLENALINLAINARDAMPNGGRLRLSCCIRSISDRFNGSYGFVEPGRYVLVSVSDTGNGMPPEIVEKIFEPFFTTKETGKGTGLGLSMVYGFIAQSGGYISVTSRPGEGTEIDLYLPRCEPPGEVISAVGSGKVSHDQGAESILFLEDDIDYRAATLSMLRDAGYEVAEAKDGQEAMAQIHGDRRFDLLVSDIGLPGVLDGIETARMARQIRPDLKVLFTTGYSELNLDDMQEWGSAVSILRKPYHRSEMLERIRAILGQSGE